VKLAGDALDFVANVLLFIPLGFLYRLTVPGTRWAGTRYVLGVGAAMSLAIETVQLFQPSRQTTLLDVVANTCGMGLGAAAFERIARLHRIDGRLIEWLALELPLMALVYLLVPLLWVNTLALGGEWPRLTGTLLIGAFGATVVGGIQRYYLGPSGEAQPRDTAGFTAIWFVAGAFAMLRFEPAVLVGGALVLACLCWLLGAWRTAETGANRRFEIGLLRSAAPLYGAYLALIVAAPLVDARGAWHFQLGFAGTTSNRLEILRLLELTAAFTLVGYMVAEMRGRAATRYAQTLPRLLAWGVSLALAVQVAHGFHPDLGGSLAHAMLLAAATVYGGWLYHLQRAHVVQHLAASRPRVRPGDDEIR
jgi:hypothetical protein